MGTDPTYMIRAIPSNGSDNIYCTLLAQSAVHGAMAGYTGFTVGPVSSRHAYVPCCGKVISSICDVAKLAFDEYNFYYPFNLVLKDEDGVYICSFSSWDV